MIIGSAALKGDCIICGAASCRCGPDTSAVRPVDIPEEATIMAGKLKVYDVEVNGQKTQMKLTEDHARRLGVLKDKPKAAASKKRTAKNKAAQ